MMVKRYIWNGRIIVDQRDRARGVAGMISSCIDYYNENDRWQHCLMTGNGGTSNEKWAWCYEILKTGTMKISCWLDKSAQLKATDSTGATLTKEGEASNETTVSKS